MRITTVVRPPWICWNPGGVAPSVLLAATKNRRRLVTRYLRNGTPAELAAQTRMPLRRPRLRARVISRSTDGQCQSEREDGPRDIPPVCWTRGHKDAGGYLQDLARIDLSKRADARHSDRQMYPEEPTHTRRARLDWPLSGRWPFGAVPYSAVQAAIRRERVRGATRLRCNCGESEAAPRTSGPRTGEAAASERCLSDRTPYVAACASCWCSWS